jgi:DNA-directed RNA polymerase subunit H (RpoH/RPB5)
MEPEAVTLVRRMVGLRGIAMPLVIMRERVLKSDIDELDVNAKHVIFIATKEWMSAARAAAQQCKHIKIEHFLLFELRHALNQDLSRYQLCKTAAAEVPYLPVMPLRDAVARVYDYKVGDVIQIRRKDGFYRRIVKDV